jgi:hypothetical protein
LNLVVPLHRQVQDRLPEWKKIGASRMVLEWIRLGYKLPIKTPIQPFHRAAWVPRTPQEKTAARELLQKLQATGVVRPATTDRFVSKSRLEPKKDGGYRLVVDLRPVNKHLHEQRCRYEDLRQMAAGLHPDDWCLSFDLQSGYYHVPIHPTHSKYLTTIIDGQLVSFQALPFGLSTAPLVFTKMMRPMVETLRRQEVRIFPYLDDFLIAAESREEAIKSQQLATSLLNRLGLKMHPEKGQQVPGQTIRHLGMEINLLRGVFRAPEDKLRSLKRIARTLLSSAKKHRRWCNGHQLEVFVGTVMSLMLAIPSARTLTRSLYDALALRHRRSDDAKLSRQAMRDLQAFADLQEWQVEAKIWPTVPTVTVTTDASDYGWGACLDDATHAGFFSPAQASLHITAKEMLAVEETLIRLPTSICNTAIRLRTDNMAVMFALRNRVSASPAMMKILRRILEFLDNRRLHLQAEYIATDLNPADPLSRRHDKTDWKVNRQLLHQWENRFGVRTFDRFATRANRVCPRFNSWRLEPESDGDAMLVPWKGHLNWLNPPFAMIGRAVAKLRREGAEALMLAPSWPSAAWYPDLMQLAKTVIKLKPRLVQALVDATNPATPEPLRNPNWSLLLVHIPSRN